MNSKGAARLFFLLLFFSALFSLRLIHLGADPPQRLDPVSPGFICDPGNYAMNARDKIILGAWKIDDWSLNYMYITPIPHYLTYLIFLFFGVGIAQMNVLPAVFSCLILVLIYLILKKTISPFFALLGAFLLGINYHFTMFSRVSNGIMVMLFFACLAVYFLLIAEGKKRVFYFLAGVSGFLSFTAKGTFLLILPALALGILAVTFFQSGKRWKIALASLGSFGLGMAVVFALWLWFFYLPNQKLFQDLGQDNANRLVPGSLRWAFRNFWTRPLYHFTHAPEVTILVLIFVLVLAYWALRTPRRLSLLDWIVGVWIISNYAYLSFAFYRPLRHEMTLIIPAVLLATLALAEFSKAEHLQKPAKIPLPFYAFLFFWLLFLISDLIILTSKPIPWKSIRPLNFRLLLSGLAATALLVLLVKLWPQKLKIPLPRFAKTAVVGGFVIIYAFLNLRPYLAWPRSPRYDIKNISLDLGKAFEKMSIGGLAAPLIVMENQHTGHGFDYYIDVRKDFLQKYRVTHLIIIPYFAEIRKYQKYYPEIMKNARLVARYPLWKTDFQLWELHPAPQLKSADEDLLEGEVFLGRPGIPRYDPAASGKYAFLAEKNQATLIRFPKLSYSAGRYEVVFFLKAGELIPGSESIARMAVVDANTKGILVSKTISGADFSEAGRYLSFPLSLILKEPADIGLEVFTSGTEALFFDKTMIRRVDAKNP